MRRKRIYVYASVSVPSAYVGVDHDETLSTHDLVAVMRTCAAVIVARDGSDMFGLPDHVRVYAIAIALDKPIIDVDANVDVALALNAALTSNVTSTSTRRKRSTLASNVNVDDSSASAPESFALDAQCTGSADVVNKKTHALIEDAKPLTTKDFAIAWSQEYRSRWPGNGSAALSRSHVAMARGVLSRFTGVDHLRKTIALYFRDTGYWSRRGYPIGGFVHSVPSLLTLVANDNASKDWGGVEVKDYA